MSFTTRLIAKLPVVLVFVFSGLIAPAGAQDRTDSTFIDTLDASIRQPFALRTFIVPGSELVRLDGQLLAPGQYRLAYRTGHLRIDSLSGRQVVVSYRTLGFQDVYRRNAPQRDTAGVLPGVARPRISPSEDLLGNPRLERSGSITRGILAGNARDVSVESGLRMQLSGEVTPGVRLRAELTDENTPIQPEGTTQRLSEFDRVSIALQTERATAELGDFELRFAGSEFGRISRKLQGGTVSASLPDGRFTGQVAGAVARGQFRSQSIQPVEGVQGPYRLEGSQGEQFIMVVAGTETVYLDGRRLDRGQAEDYTIDYQTGEITFTPEVLITADRRILVEFQYKTSEYDRTLIGARSEASFASGRARFGAVWLREADSRRFNAELGLTSADSLLLTGAGDRQAVRSGAEPVSFDPEAPFVQYIRRDTVDQQGRTDSIFVAVNDMPTAEERVYRVRFSRVGSGTGSYVRSGRVNGIQYEWVGPGLGDYEPVRIIPAPQDHQLLSFSGSTMPIDGIEIFGEWSRSMFDRNRISALDAADDPGQAYRGGFRFSLVPGLEAVVSRRFIGGRFHSFERVREVEFERKWNLAASGVSVPVGLTGRDETVDEVSLQWRPLEESLVRVEAGAVDIGNVFDASRRALMASSAGNGIADASYTLEYITSQDSMFAERGQWIRQLFTVRKPVAGRRLTPYLEVEHEDRRQRPLGADTLRRGSFRYFEYRPGLAWQGGPVHASAEVEYRTDREPFGTQLLDAGKAWTVRSSIRIQPGGSFFSDGTLGYRIRRNGDARLPMQERGESVVLRWNTRYAPLRRAVEISGFYEALTERTPILQEVYVLTGPEYTEAQYVWEDLNGDGVLQVDEFLPETTPNEGTYAQVFVPSDSLAATIGVQARLRLSIEPGRYWKGNGILAKSLRHLNGRTTVEVVEKSRESDLARIYLLDPAYLRRPGTTMNGRLRFGQEISLFRFDPRYGIDLGYHATHTLSELAGGQERRALDVVTLEGRYRLADAWTGRLNVGREKNRVHSERFASRRYDLTALRAGAELNWNGARNWNSSIGADVVRRADDFSDREALMMRIPASLRIARPQQFQLIARLEPALVRLTGEADGLALYELTEGRGPGRSLLWSLHGEYSVSRYLRAILAYDGRDPQDRAPIHTVRLQMTATF